MRVGGVASHKIQLITYWSILIYFDANYVATAETISSSSEYLNFHCLQKALYLL